MRAAPERRCARVAAITAIVAFCLCGAGNGLAKRQKTTGESKASVYFDTAEEISSYDHLAREA